MESREDGQVGENRDHKHGEIVGLCFSCMHSHLHHTTHVSIFVPSHGRIKSHT
ncbi:hypothetical protein Scep_013550 [Stephania cephalantha]|uniref:Uncharacterized protein n=1 Tax=Stephania cephalantha TaxID=152367 RepID=A0AAP0JHJ1_9MAGN